MRLVFRRTLSRGPIRFTLGRRGVSASTGAGPARIGLSRRGLRASLRVARGVSARWGL